MYLYWSYVSTIILAGTLGIVLYSPYQRVCNHISEKKAATIVIAITFLLILVIGYFIVSVFISSSGYLVQMTETILVWLHSLPDLGFMKGSILGSSASIAIGFIENTIFQIAYTFPGFLVHTLFFMLSLYLFLLKGKNLVDEFFSAMPEHLKGVSQQLKNDVVNTLYATYVVNLQICVLTFLIALPFFALLGVKGGVVANATLAAVSQLVPTIGPLLVLIFIGLYALALGDVTLAIAVIIIGYILFMVIPGSILKPKMMGKRISLPAPMMMIAIIGAIAAIGLAGIILGPLFASLLVSGYRLLITQIKVMKGDLLLTEKTGI